ncbi:MAG TPA: HEAT repeat domain-containing protein [Gemmatimonadales bacterium]|nr:HEAT repeat domain-containing protein [Gemmatimonadales bacterium]
MRRLIGITPLLVACLADSAGGQALTDRILAVREGTVRLSYEVREGICGDGESFIRDNSRGEDNITTFDDGNVRWSGKGSWRNRACVPGPARVAITKSDGEVTRLRLYVGGEWTGSSGNITDLGMISAPVAARALVSLANRAYNADKAIYAAIIADSAVVWPELLALAKDSRSRTPTRKQAVFWLSQAAGDEATKGLSELAEDDAEDREVRDQAVFALSQLDHNEGVPILIRIAKTNRDPKIRRKALFWLGQSDDPRALKLFEEILTKG